MIKEVFYGKILQKSIRNVALYISILFLCGCSGDIEQKSMKNDLVKGYGFEMEEELIEYIGENFDKKQEYSMGNGIVVLDLDKKSDNELQMFPIYCDNELAFLVLYGNGAIYLSDPELLNSIAENDEYLILKAEQNVYFASKEKLLLLCGEEKELPKKTIDKIDKIRNGTIEKNLMGIEKRAIRIMPEQENQQSIINEARYYNDRIIVRLVSDKVKNKIRMYEAFCHGRVEETESEDFTYVFLFEPLDSNNLQVLLDASKALSYVLDASLVEKTESLAEDIDLTTPVTEKVPFD